MIYRIDKFPLFPWYIWKYQDGLFWYKIESYYNKITGDDYWPLFCYAKMQ